jgi:hypothetical protein
MPEAGGQCIGQLRNGLRPVTGGGKGGDKFEPRSEPSRTDQSNCGSSRAECQ